MTIVLVPISLERNYSTSLYSILRF